MSLSNGLARKVQAAGMLLGEGVRLPEHTIKMVGGHRSRT